MKIKPTLLASILLVTNTAAQEYVWPTDAGTMFSSNFGEYRDHHFHMGVDIKTGEKEGASAIAIHDGYISRMVANFTGFGKALYLTTSDGNTAVYAHLSWFSPLLESVLQNIQNENDSYMVNAYFDPEDFPILKGEVIGYTGNTGSSSGPHLHFELRNKEEQPLNPLAHGLPVQDRVPPIFRELAVIPLSADTWINGARLPQVFPLHQDKSGVYRFPDTLNCLGKVGLAVKAVDKREGANNIYQLRKIELWIDGKKHYTLQFDTLDYAETKKVHTVRDYSLDRLNLGSFSKLYRMDSYGNATVAKDHFGRPFNVSPGFHTIEIKGFDAAGNMSKAAGKIFGNPPFDMMIEDVTDHADEIQFTFLPSKIVIPIEEVIAYSFTSYGYADRKIDVTAKKSSKEGIVVSFPKKQIERRAVQFIGINKLGAYSKPVHWMDAVPSASVGQTGVDLDISHSETGVFIQVETEQAVSAEVSLALNQGGSLMPMKLEQTHPNVYLTKLISPEFFNGIKGINVTIADNSEREVRFALQPQVAKKGEPVTIISQDKLCSMRTKNNSMYFPTVMWIETIKNAIEPSEGNRLSGVYQLQPFEIPLKDSIHVGIRFGEKIKNKQNIGLYYYDKGDGWTFVKSIVSKKRKVITGSLTSLEAIAVIQDISPPRITDAFPGNGGNYESYTVEVIRISVKDDLSDINTDEKSMALSLDGEKVRFAYQPVLQEFTYNLDAPLSPGPHSMELMCHDKAGNRTNRTINFTIN